MLTWGIKLCIVWWTLRLFNNFHKNPLSVTIEWIRDALFLPLWFRGMLDTIVPGLRTMMSWRYSPRALTYDKRDFLLSDGEKASLWWLNQSAISEVKGFWRESQPSRTKITWVLVPGGLGCGFDFYILDFIRSGAMHHIDDVVTYVPPGQGGSSWKSCTKHAGRYGFSDATYLREVVIDLAQKHPDNKIVCCGFSAGGMAVSRLAEAELPVEIAKRVSCISCCAPDYIRNVFERLASSMCRMDIMFAFVLYISSYRNGLVARACRSSKFWAFPFIPTWYGFIKPFSEENMSQSLGKKVKFEDIEETHFCGAPSKYTSLRSLRIHCTNDPVVDYSTLLPERLCHFHTVWLPPRGGHLGLFRHYPELGAKIRAWVGGQHTTNRVPTSWVFVDRLQSTPSNCLLAIVQ